MDNQQNQSDPNTQGQQPIPEIPPMDQIPEAVEPPVESFVSPPQEPATPDTSQPVVPPPPAPPAGDPPPPPQPPANAGSSSNKKLLMFAVTLIFMSVVFALTFVFRYTQFTTQNEATSKKPASCPANTSPLFTKTGSLNVGHTVNFGGKVTKANSSWKVASRDGIILAEDGTELTVEFPSNVYMDTVLIYDNDPKSGEKGWSINGKMLPTAPDNDWIDPYKLNITSNKMEFTNNDDSPHFNVCIGPLPTPTPTKVPSPTPTKVPSPTITPTPTLTKTPTPTKTPSPTNTPSPTPNPSETPTPTMCPKPAEVTNIKVSCPACE